MMYDLVQQLWSNRYIMLQPHVAACRFIYFRQALEPRDPLAKSQNLPLNTRNFNVLITTQRKSAYGLTRNKCNTVTAPSHCIDMCDRRISV